jgi:protease-4
MNDPQDTPLTKTPAGDEASAPQSALEGDAPSAPVAPGRPAAQEAAAPAVTAAGLESRLDLLAAELLRDRRAERRWRVFFRLAWLGLALAVAWALFAKQVHVSAPTAPHTALLEIRGEIAMDTEASAAP